MFRRWQFLPLLLAAAVALPARAAAPTPTVPTRAAGTPAAAELLPPEPPPDLIPDHGAASTTFAKFWTGAFVTGNGTLGAMVMGANTATTPPRPQEDAIFFSHNRLYLPLGTKEVVPQLGDSLTLVRQLIRTRGYGPAVAAAQAAAQKQGYPGPMYPDPYVPALELRLKMPAAGTPRNYLRTENFASGEVAVRWTDDAGTYLRKIFISRADNLAVLWIGPAGPAKDAAKPRTISCEFWIPPIPGVPVRTFQLNNPAAAPADSAASALVQASVDVDAGGMALHAQYREGRETGYDAALRVIPDGGTTDAVDGRVVIKDAASVLVLLRIQPFTQITSNSEVMLRASLAEIPPDYDALLAAHARIHGALFDRVSLHLAGDADRKLTTDALIARANTPRSTLPPALLEKLYEGSRYALLSSAGARPPNLQGLWAATWAPAYSLAGDYAFNAPFQLSIASALSCRTPELLQGLFALSDECLPDWQTNARNLFNTRGILVPMHQSSNGKNLEWSERLPAGLCWTAGAATLAHWYYDYYLYTGDRKFLADKAVPFMKQAAAFYEDFLFLDADGKFRFSPSQSTDNAPGDNSAVDIQAATELLTHLVAACQSLHIEADSVTRWQRMLAQMPPLLVAANGELQEWALPNVLNKPLQRHIPHLYGIYPAGQLDPEATPELWKGAQAAFTTRYSQWFCPPTTPADTLPQPIQDRLQMGLCAARFGNGAQVGEVLTRLASRNIYPSMLTQRYEDGRTMVVDGAGAIPEILNNALLYSQPGRIDLLPALPPELPAGEIRGLSARSMQPDHGPAGQIVINSLQWSPAAIDVTLTSTIDQTITLHLPKSADGPLSRPITLSAGQPATLHFPQH